MNRIRIKIFLLALSLQCLTLVAINGQSVPNLSSDTIFQKKQVLTIKERVADWQLKSWEANGSKWSWGDWTNASWIVR